MRYSPTAAAGAGPRRLDAAVAAGLAAFVFLLCALSGPVSIDATDGAEMAVSAHRLEIPHSPGYPLLMCLLRLGGFRDYNHLRLLGCVLSGLAAAAAYAAIRSFGPGPPASAGACLMVVSSGAVLGQLHLLEVHGLALLLASSAVALRRTRLGPYAMGMSVFGGHPLSVVLLPMVTGRRWLRWWPLLAIPATLWVYVPIRSQTAAVMHYGSPGSLESFLEYLTMYGGRLSSASADGVWSMLAAMGAGSALALLAAIALGRAGPKILVSVLGGLAVLLFYGVPDVHAYSWLLLLPLGAMAARGLQWLLSTGSLPWRALAALLVAVSVVSGTRAAWDRSGGTMRVIASDLIRGAPAGRVLCTSDGPTYFCAYMLEAEDRRPDLIPVERFGIAFRFRPFREPLRRVPPELAGRQVYATGAWGSLPPSGLLFSAGGVRLEWEEYDVFTIEGPPEEEMARDMLAEIWSMRALQEESGAAAAAALSRAREMASSPAAVQAVERLMEGMAAEDG